MRGQIGEGGPHSWEDLGSPRMVRPLCNPFTRWVKIGALEPAGPGSALISCETMSSSCKTLFLSFPSCQGGIITELNLTALLNAFNEMIYFKLLDPLLALDRHK